VAKITETQKIPGFEPGEDIQLNNLGIVS